MRARNLKPGLFKNEILGQADPIITLLFEGLWCLADKLGRVEDRPLRIKAELFPYRDGLDVNGYLTDLERWGFIQRYQVGSLKIIQVLNFEKHQSPHHTERGSELPAKSDGCVLTVNPPLLNGENPPDSLIPSSLIPSSPTGEVPSLQPTASAVPPAPKKRKKEHRVVKTHLKPESVEAWAAVLECTPKAIRVWSKENHREEDKPVNAGSRLLGEERFQRLVDGGEKPGELYAAWWAYLNEHQAVKDGFVQQWATFYGPQKGTWLEWMDRGRMLLSQETA